MKHYEMDNSDRKRSSKLGQKIIIENSTPEKKRKEIFVLDLEYAAQLYYYFCNMVITSSRLLKNLLGFVDFIL